MSLDSFRARAERRHVALFRDECRLERPSGMSSFDPETGQTTPDPPTLIYEGPCQFRANRWDGTQVMVGGSEVQLKDNRLHLPRAVTPNRNDLVTWTTSTYNDDGPGRTFRVDSLFYEGWKVVTQVLIEEVESG